MNYEISGHNKDKDHQPKEKKTPKVQLKKVGVEQNIKKTNKKPQVDKYTLIHRLMDPRYRKPSLYKVAQIKNNNRSGISHLHYLQLMTAQKNDYREELEKKKVFKHSYIDRLMKPKYPSVVWGTNWGKKLKKASIGEGKN